MTTRFLLSQQLLSISEEPCYPWTNQHHSETHDTLKTSAIRRTLKITITYSLLQCTKKLMDFVYGLVDFILHLPVKVLGELLEEINLIHDTCETFLGLVKITSRLAHPGYSLPKGQAAYLNFLVPSTLLNGSYFFVGYLSLEFCNEILEQGIVKVFTTKVCVTICRFDLRIK